MKYFHTPKDEAGSLDYDYLEKFMRAFAYGAFLIADAEEMPYWKAGDEFETIGDKLYESKK